MKKVTRIIGAICMMGLLTFVSTSCKKNQDNNGETTINVVVPGFEEDGERAYIDESFLFNWHSQDYIRVYNLAKEEDADESATAIYQKVGTTTGPTARFRGTSLGAKKDEGYRIFYPVEMVKGDADEVNANLWNDNRQVFHVSDRQQFECYLGTNHPVSLVDGSAMPMAVEVEDLTAAAELKHIFGVAAFQLRATTGSAIRVDSIKLIDSVQAITGDVSLKLHKVNAQDLSDAVNAFFNNEAYHTNYELYYGTEVMPLLSEDNLFWEPSSKGHDIMLNCTYDHDGKIQGEVLATGNNNTDFAFMIRPLALIGGFTLEVYIEGYAHNPLILTNADFYRPGHQTLDYTWATRTRAYKRYIISLPINNYLR